ncbi:hypothetical protein ACH4F6_31400 [Streptomyces sp. NPDC017936]|uniref:hypothetical protein n=1 Tax=Streptomyces sp. NPDC017936 TaxID=3365016 RepID=UPI00378B1ADC
MATDSYGQSITLYQNTEAPNLEALVKNLADGVIPRGILRFSSASARAATLTSPVEGMVTWLQDVNRLYVYDGSAWQELPYNSRLFAYKPSNTSRASTTSATADPHLTFTVEANTVYTLSGLLIFDGHDSGDLKIGFTAPAGTTGSWWPGGPDSSSAAAFAAYPRWGALTDVTSSTMAIGTIGAGTILAAEPKGLVVTSGTPGTFSLVWAQNTSNATATVLRTHSWLRLDRM